MGERPEIATGDHETGAAARRLPPLPYRADRRRRVL